MRSSVAAAVGVLALLCLGGGAAVFLRPPPSSSGASAVPGPDAAWWEEVNLSGVNLGMTEDTVPVQVPEAAWQRLHDGYERLESDKDGVAEIWTCYGNVVGVHASELRHGSEVAARVGDPPARLDFLGSPHWSGQFVTRGGHFEAWLHNDIVLEATIQDRIADLYLVNFHRYRDMTFNGGWQPP